MTWLLVAVIGCLAVAVVYLLLRPSRILADRTRSQVVVTLKTGRAFRGLLAEVDDQVLVLRSAELLGPDPVAVDNEVIVLLAEVEFLQRP